MSRVAWTVSAFSLTVAALGCVPGEGEESSQRRCQEFAKRVVECYDQRCCQQDAPLPFCTCWKHGMDLNMDGCGCVARDINSICLAANLDAIDPSQFACDKAIGILKTSCAGTSVSAPPGTVSMCAGEGGAGGQSSAPGGVAGAAAGSGSGGAPTGGSAGAGGASGGSAPAGGSTLAGGRAGSPAAGSPSAGSAGGPSAGAGGTS